MNSYTRQRQRVIARLGLLILCAGLFLSTSCYQADDPRDQQFIPTHTDYGSVPSDLRPGYQEIYLDVVARAYQTDPTLDLAMMLGPGWTHEELHAIIQAMLDTTPSAEGERIARLQNLDAAVNGLTFPPVRAESGSAETPEAIDVWRLDQSRRIVSTLGLIILIAAILPLAYILLRKSPLLNKPVTNRYRRTVEPTTWKGESQKPLVQFATTYTLGDNNYDPSHSIEATSGKFLGEFGVSIAQTTGQRKPKKVSAFEVWLFDKNDVNTVTQILASERAYHDETLRAKLASKGPIVLARPGQTIKLETALLRVWARVVERSYKEDEKSKLPPNTVFEKLTLELAAWQIKGKRRSGSQG